MAYGHVGKIYPSEPEQRRAWAAVGVELGGQVEPVWIDHEARKQSKQQRWEQRDAMVARMQREEAPIELVVTHLHVLGAGVSDIAATLSAIARPGNLLTVTSIDRTFDLSSPDAPELALRIAEAPSDKARVKAALMRESVKRRTPRILTPAQEAEIVRRRAEGETHTALAAEFRVSVGTIQRTIRRAHDK